MLSYTLILAKKGLGYILGDFFTNSSLVTLQQTQDLKRKFLFALISPFSGGSFQWAKQDFLPRKIKIFNCHQLGMRSSSRVDRLGKFLPIGRLFTLGSF
jgi:hypothetical protein